MVLITFNAQLTAFTSYSLKLCHETCNMMSCIIWSKAFHPAILAQNEKRKATCTTFISK
jgi:hypothetical protein